MADKMWNVKKDEKTATGISPRIVVRLIKDKFTAVGLLLVFFVSNIALFGYLIMPDSTPYANEGAVQIQKQLPGFSVQVLKIRKNQEVEQRSLLEKMWSGQPSEFTIVPITEYRIEDFTIFVRMFGREEVETEFPLLGAVKTLFVGESDKLSPGRENVVFRGDTVLYLDLNENINFTSRQELIEEFLENNVEQRTYILGTDRAGRDIFSRLLLGTRISLGIGTVAVLISLVLGTTLGVLAGYFGGKADAFIMWLVSVVWTIPAILMAIAISMALHSRGVWVAFIAIGFSIWTEVARVVRGEIFAIREKQFVEAAKSIGIGDLQIIYKYILPNIAVPLLILATGSFSTAILLEGGLSFLGFGVQAPAPSWGNMLHEGFQAIGTRNSWHMILFPGLAICLTVLAFNLLGIGLRDTFDPQNLLKLKR